MEMAQTQVSVSELKMHLSKYLSLAETQDILVTKHGRAFVKLTSTKVDRVSEAKALFSMFPDGADGDIGRAREERFG